MEGGRKRGRGGVWAREAREGGGEGAEAVTIFIPYKPVPHLVPLPSKCVVVWLIVVVF